MKQATFEKLVQILEEHPKFILKSNNKTPVFMQVAVVLWRFANCHFGYPSCLEKNKKRKISATSRMRRQLTGDIPDMIVYYDRYELGVAEVGKVEADSTKLLNDGSKISHVMKSMLLNLSNHCPVRQLAIEGMIMSGLNINFFQLTNPNGYVCVINKKNEYFYPVHAKEFTKKMIPLLKQIWINKLTMEARLDTVLTAEPNSSQSIIPPCFQKLK